MYYIIVCLFVQFEVLLMNMKTEARRTLINSLSICLDIRLLFIQGGKVAQSVLMNRETAKRVNTVIAIAAPIDKPVVNIDFYMEAFYRKSNKLWLEHRPPNPNLITNLTNTCCNATNFIEYNATLAGENESNVQVNLATQPKSNDNNATAKRYFLDDILFITIGGGSRDILVQSGLTTSQFSDVHAMSTCMPGVWLTTDHLASVWCLQQVLVVNRFLYSIIEPHRQHTKNYIFVDDKAVRLANAKHHLTVNYFNFFGRNSQLYPYSE